MSSEFGVASALAFLAWVGLALVALLFVADATLEDRGPAIAVSDRVGLPKPWHTTPTPGTAPIPVPEMTSPTGLSAQPESETEAQVITPTVRAARAEAPQKKRVTRPPADHQENHVRQSQPQQNLADKFSIQGQ